MPDNTPRCDSNNCPHPAVYLVTSYCGNLGLCCGVHLNSLIEKFRVRFGYVAVVQSLAAAPDPRGEEGRIV